jgi:hypothetical protein
MAEANGMTELAERKRALLQEAELHRQVLTLEALNLEARTLVARETMVRHKWWLLGGGALAAGVLLARRPRRLLDFLPTILSALRSFRS